MSYFIDMDTFSFIHISDLHIGKKLNGYDLHEDQKYVLEKIVDIVRKRKPDAVLIAGDVYDRTNPSEDAIALLNDFLVKLQATGSEVFVIGGNHDPGEKLSFLSNIVDGSGLHIVGKFSGKLEKRSIGNVDIYLLPYICTCDVRRYFPDSPIESTSDALRVVLDSAPQDKDKINVLVAHQAVLGALSSGSEDSIIGGESPVPSSLFSDFDYVALGHIHRCQPVGCANIRYPGSMLKYSIDDAKEKFALYGKILDDGELEMEEIKLESIHDVVVLRGSFSSIVSGGSSDDYVAVVLTDETDVPDALPSLMGKFPRLLSMVYDNARSRTTSDIVFVGDDENERTPGEYFGELFEMIARKKIGKSQLDVLEDAIKEIWGGDV